MHLLVTLRTPLKRCRDSTPRDLMKDGESRGRRSCGSTGQTSGEHAVPAVSKETLFSSLSELVECGCASPLISPLSLSSKTSRLSSLRLTNVLDNGSRCARLECPTRLVAASSCLVLPAVAVEARTPSSSNPVRERNERS